MKKQRCIILIDGSNFYFKLKSLGFHNLLGFDFSALSKLLAGRDKVVNATYYIGKISTNPKDRKGKKMLADQQKLFEHLKKNNFNYSLGYLLKSDGVYHEKGVDVNIAVDILVATYEKLCERIILVSSDTDLLPAIKKAREKGQIVEYVGFSHQRSYALVNLSSKYKLLKKEDIVGLINKKEDKQK